MPATDRPLPDFLVIGAMRAGTTSLQQLLAAQPALCMPAMKETDYFIGSKNHRRGPAWYRSRFDRPELLCGDISPNCTKRDVFPEAASLAHAANPALKILYVLRDPVERAISQYRHAWLNDPACPAPEELLGTDTGAHILNTSRYDWQLEPWRAQFGDDAILLLDFEQLAAAPAQAIGHIGRFLGVSMQTDGNFDRANSADDLARLPGWWAGFRESPLGSTLRAALPRRLVDRAKATASATTAARTPPPVSAAVRAQIADRLRPDADTLRRRSGEAFGHWSI